MNHNDTEQRSTKSLWAFSCKVYGKNRVAKALIEMQDRHGIDVNVILFLCWLARRGLGPLDEKLVLAITAAAIPWQQGVIRPLRSVRRQMKAMEGMEAHNVYKSLKASELEAERAEQESLVSVLDLVACDRLDADAESAMRAALGYYFRGHKLTAKDKNAVNLVVSVALKTELEGEGE